MLQVAPKQKFQSWEITFLRITGDGSRVSWNSWSAKNGFTKLSDSLIKVGSQLWTTVMLVYSPTSIVLFEDNVYRFNRAYSPVSIWNAVFEVRHLDVNSSVSVDLSNFRAV